MFGVPETPTHPVRNRRVPWSPLGGGSMTRRHFGAPRRWLAAVGALLLAAGGLRADTVVLRDGRVITGHVIEQGDKIYIEVRDPAGTTVLGGLAVARSEVVRIETAAGGA